MGMSYDEYWNQDPWLAKDYRDAHKIKQDNDNYMAWLQGLYNYKAVSVAVYNNLRKEGQKADEYFERPIGVEEKKKTPEENRQALIDYLSRFKERFDARN